MQGSKKIAAAFALATFLLVAVSVICLASGQPSLMTDCGGQMGGTAMCPFMSVSIPATIGDSFGKGIVFAFILLAVFAVALAIHRNDPSEIMALQQCRHSHDNPPISFSNSVLKLISKGILHSRVFSR